MSVFVNGIAVERLPVVPLAALSLPVGARRGNDAGPPFSCRAVVASFLAVSARFLSTGPVYELDLYWSIQERRILP